MRSLSGFYDVDCNGTLFRCKGRGKLRHQKQKPLVGDMVEFTPVHEQEGVLESILPRKNALTRPAVANMQQLILIASAAVPITDPFLIDRMTALAQCKGCEPILVFNKWDLTPAQEMADLYRDAGFQVIPCSAKTGLGIDRLREMLSGKVSVFTGNSGVGKSSVLNALDSSCAIPTGEVSEKLGRGRHTTRHVELFRLPGGAYVADTPGFSAFEEQTPELLDPIHLAEAFRDFRPYLSDCLFQDCAHLKEKGCAVLAALAEGKIAVSRHQSYVRLYQQAKEFHPWENKQGGRS